MAKDGKRSLKKREFSGQEVGQALLASTIHDINHQKDDDYTPLYSPEEFEQMENSLSSEQDFLVYGVYRDIYGAIIDAYNRGQGFFQQFSNGYFRYVNAMYLCQQADDALKRAQNAPLVLTQIQYDHALAQATSHLNAQAESLHGVFFFVLEQFISAPEMAPQEIRELLESTKNVPATNQRILSRCNKDFGNGYYMLSDGQRNDTMPHEEWQSALKTHLFKNYEKILPAAPATPEDAYHQYSEQRLLKTYKLFFLGMPYISRLHEELFGEKIEKLDAALENEIMRTLEEMLYGGDSVEENPKWRNKEKSPLPPVKVLINKILNGTEQNIIVWNYHEKPPELSKFDVLNYCLDRYSGALSDDISPTAQFKEFRADYPELYTAMIAYIKKSVPEMKSLRSSQYFKASTTWGDLANLNIIGYKTLTTPAPADIAKQALGKNRNPSGIAIIKNPAKSQLDHDNNYIQNANVLDVLTTLEILENDKAKQAELDSYRDELFVPALRFIYAFNALMKIIGEVFDIENTDSIQLKTKLVESQLKSFQDLMHIFYADVCGDTQEKKHKREIIKKFFRPVDIKDLKPSENAKKAVKAELAKLGFTPKARKALKNFDRYIAILSGTGG